MNFRFMLLGIGICAAAGGCATQQEQTAAPTAAPTAVAKPQPIPRYVTGSRIPVREEDTGASSVNAASKEAVQDDMMQRMNTGSSGK